MMSWDFTTATVARPLQAASFFGGQLARSVPHYRLRRRAISPLHDDPYAVAVGFVSAAFSIARGLAARAGGASGRRRLVAGAVLGLRSQ